MSIRRITAVWDHSDTKGNDRLCLIVLADKANDEGYCWPGITCIQDQMNATRQTALNCLDRLDAMGEIYSERVQRVGSKYLVLPGLTDEQVVASLITHFSLTPDEARAELATILDKRHKSRNHTSNMDANLDRINRAKKSRNHTKKVYRLDQNSLAARLDPSLPVIETSVSADAPASPVVAPVEPPVEPTPPSEREVIRDEVLVVCGFPTTGATTKGSYGRAGKITRYLMGQLQMEGTTTYQMERADWYAKPGDFTRFGQWWHKRYKDADVPRSLEKLQERWAEWREYEAGVLARMMEQTPTTAATRAEAAIYGLGETA